MVYLSYLITKESFDNESLRIQAKTSAIVRANTTAQQTNDKVPHAVSFILSTIRVYRWSQSFFMIHSDKALFFARAFSMKSTWRALTEIWTRFVDSICWSGNRFTSPHFCILFEFSQQFHIVSKVTGSRLVLDTRAIPRGKYVDIGTIFVLYSMHACGPHYKIVP